MKITYKFLLLLVLLFNSCAYRVAPDGGPIDTEPPYIISTYPVQNTTEFNEKSINITFSEYIDKTTFKKNILISPKLKYDFDIDWTGTTATLYFWDTLQPNTTYVITFNKDIRDYNNKNPMDAPFQLKFSTGKEILNNTIEGQIFAQQPEIFNIWAYDIKKYYDPTLTYPDYLTQPDKSGKFTLTGLKNSTYLVIAVNDKNNNNLYDFDEDYGIHYNYINFDTTTNNKNVNLLTTTPIYNYKITDISLLDSNTVKISFSNNISNVFNYLNFVIIDSSQENIISHKGLLDSKNILILSENKLISHKLKIVINNTQKFTTDTLNFKNKTTNYNLITPSNLIISKDIDIDDKIISIKLPFFTKNNHILSSLSFDEQSNWQVNKIDDLNYNITFKDILSDLIQIKVNFKLLPNYKGLFKDTIVTYKIPVNKENICRLQGQIISKDKQDKLLIFKNINDGKILTRKIVNNRININNLPQGKYTLLVSEYAGKNSYDFGSIKPVVLSRYFVPTNDTLIVNKRWPIIDYKMNFYK